MPARALVLALAACVFAVTVEAADVCAKLPGPTQAELYPWLDARCYLKLYDAKIGWTRDKAIRDTGPYIAGATVGVKTDLDYGVHPAVRIYYSPDVMQWLIGGRIGDIPDGGIIVKEMYFPSNATFYNTLPPAEQAKKLSSWTVMVKSAKGAWDGWFWAYKAVPTPDPNDDDDLESEDQSPHSAKSKQRSYGDIESGAQKLMLKQATPFTYDTNSGFGLYCLRCHASAKGEQTFISTDNIEGYPGEIISYLKVQPVPTGVAPAPPSPPAIAQTVKQSLAFLQTFDYPKLDIPLAKVKSFPPAVYDHVVRPLDSDPKMQFLTSDQCSGCHDATVGIQWGPNMLTTDDRGRVLNYSVFGEWQASMMGLAGRDPIFHAQLESEVLRIPALGKDDFASNLCYRCHGVMGQKQLEHDSGGKRKFSHDLVYEFRQELDRNSYGDAKYAALARDGISCAVCHQIDVKEPGKPLPMDQTTGEFLLGPSNVINGPFATPLLKPMDHALGLVPKESAIVKSGALCGTCHTVTLPVFRRDGSPVMEDGKQKTDLEQATYLEWLNSVYQNEVGPPRARQIANEARTCQSCHMPSTKDRKPGGEPWSFRLANIEDDDYPFTTNRLPDEEIAMQQRSPFSRHALVGINQFGLEMFRQFSSILGNALTDWLAPPEAQKPLVTAIESSQQLVREETARVAISGLRRTGEAIEATVSVANLAGHKLPSGVGFRRAFLEVQLLDRNGRVLWASGSVSPAGVILGANGKPLLTEFFDARHGNGTRPQKIQQHWQVISSPDQVQIYEEVELDPDGWVTTSFFSRSETIKDNRLMPRGWSRDGAFAHETRPIGTGGDVDFENGSGGDSLVYRIPLTPALRDAASITAKLHYQATPPYYLAERFALAANAPRGSKVAEIERLYAIGSRLETQDTNIRNWTLEVAATNAALE